MAVGARLMDELAKKPDVVVLVHGIRTRAHWQRTLPGWLSVKGKLDVIPISYGYVGLAGFLNPVVGRKRRVADVLKQLNEIRAEYPAGQCHMSIIAHSYGTYLTTRALEENTYLTIGDLLLCGSIAPDDLDWAKIRNQTRDRKGEFGKGEILNDCGSSDVWPVIARVATWGFDSTGTYGVRRNPVIDRYHPLRHSDFFERGFVDKYWKPFVHGSEIVEADYEFDKTVSPGYFSLFELPIKSLLAVLAIVAMVWAMPGQGVSGRLDTVLVALGLKGDAQSEQKSEQSKRNRENFVGETLQKFLISGPNGTADPAHEKKMEAWLRSKGIPASVSVFLLDERYADSRGQMLLDMLSTTPAEPAKPTQSLLSPEKMKMARLIETQFREAGYGRVQQVAAIANALAESGLDPNARLQTGGGDSVGLFQLNRTGGLGTGLTVDQLVDPMTNIGLILKETKRYNEFGSATTLEDAVGVFVRYIERPRDKQAEIAKRLQLARTLNEIL